jgi:hypothetical protein
MSNNGKVDDLEILQRAIDRFKFLSDTDSLEICLGLEALLDRLPNLKIDARFGREQRQLYSRLAKVIENGQ